MSTTKPTAAEKLDARIQETVTTVIKEQFDHYLSDISFRIKQAYDLLDRQAMQTGSAATINGKVYAEDLHILGRHMITGYAVTNDSPAVGSIAWSDLKMVYNGVETPIANGNTANTYAWWSATTTPGVLQTSNTKPTLATGDVLLFLNKAGKHTVMLSDSNTSLPAVVANLAVDNSAIQPNAVDAISIKDDAIKSNHIFAGAVGGTELSDGAINRNNIMGANTVLQTAIGPNAVTATEIKDGAIVRSQQLGTGVVIESTIQANAVTSNAIKDGAITRSTQLQDNVVNTNQIATNAVTTAEIKPGAVSATKLAIMRHIIF